MVSPVRYEGVAIALIVRDSNGGLHIIGSKEIKSFEIEMSREEPAFDPYLNSYRCSPRPRQNFHFEADCSSALWQVTTPVPLPPQIEQRGIYLPDMSFRALPSPEERHE